LPLGRTSFFRMKPAGEVWKQYMRAVVPEDATKVPTERKTGVYVPNVETTRLVRDERGWLRLAS
jgi:hypothetical protein